MMKKMLGLTPALMAVFCLLQTPLYAQKANGAVAPAAPAFVLPAEASAAQLPVLPKQAAGERNTPSALPSENLQKQEAIVPTSAKKQSKKEARRAAKEAKAAKKSAVSLAVAEGKKTAKPSVDKAKANAAKSVTSAERAAKLEARKGEVSVANISAPVVTTSVEEAKANGGKVDSSRPAAAQTDVLKTNALGSASALNNAAPAADQAQEREDFVVQREAVSVPRAKPVVAKTLVVYNPKNKRDPTLSPDDFLLLQYRDQQRLAALEADRQRKLAEEQRKRDEAERLRQMELARIKDPTREVRNKITVGGIIGQEVFIGNRIYTVGKSLFGARIVEVRPEEVVFSYKGHKFTRKVQLK